jgi:hypothetical protein
MTVDELTAILPNLIKSGSEGLIWPRVEPVREPYGALAFTLEAAYGSIQECNQRAQEAIAIVVSRLNDVGIEPFLVKGWSTSQQYPALLLRPAGDTVLRVRRDEYGRALELLSDSLLPPANINVDMKHPSTWKERASDFPRVQFQIGKLPTHVHRTPIQKLLRQFLLYIRIRVNQPKLLYGILRPFAEWLLSLDARVDRALR